jgi:hypothetical protein
VSVYCLLKYFWRVLVSKDVLTLLFAALAVLFGALAWRIAKITLTYMRGRDLELDTRNGWIEIHKAMVNLRVQRSLVMLQGSALGAHTSSGPNQAEERIRDYTLATAQLRGQLDRLNDDPLVEALSTFLNENNLTAQWQTQEYETKFDEFSESVAMKSRPGQLGNIEGGPMGDLLLRDRLKDLNTKAYYLLVALSFVYAASAGSRWLKAALTLTALVAVLPVQDYVNSVSTLEFIRKCKILGLVLALACTLWWIWIATPTVANSH